MIALLVILSLFAYVQIGYWFGHWSWHVWTTKPRESFSARLLYPLTSRFDEEYGQFRPDRSNEAFITDFSRDHELRYRHLMCGTWLAKLVWSLLVGGTLFLVLDVGKRLLMFAVHGPEAAVRAIRAWGATRARPAKSAAAASFVAPPPEATSPVARIDQINAQMAALADEKTKLERRPDAARP